MNKGKFQPLSGAELNKVEYDMLNALFVVDLRNTRAKVVVLNNLSYYFTKLKEEFRTIENRVIKITHTIVEAKIQFKDHSGNYIGIYLLPQIHIKPFPLSNDYQFLLGLNFIFSLNGDINITKNSVTIVYK